MLKIVFLLVISESAAAAETIKYRISKEYKADEGLFEVLYNGTWGTVCDDGFTTESAIVACRSIGYNTTGSVLPQGWYADNYSPVWVGGVRCMGHELTIDDCPHSPWGQKTSCTSSFSYDVSIACISSTTSEEHGLHTGDTVGIVIGCVVGLLLFCCICWCCYRHCCQDDDESSEPENIVVVIQPAPARPISSDNDNFNSDSVETVEAHVEITEVTTKSTRMAFRLQ